MLLIAGGASAQICYRPPCPPGQNYVEGIGCQTAIDPAFITYDAVRSTMKSVIAAGTNGGDLRGASETAKELMDALGQVKTGEQARSLAYEAWRMKVPTELQRHALALAQSLGKASSEAEGLKFLLAALDDPAAELERCREWSRGNAMDKRRAADHLALLLQNPNLADRVK